MSCWALCTAQFSKTFYIKPNASTTCENPCHELEIYLRNSSYYFQSNTQFIFLPGVHYFDTGIPLAVEGKENILLMGSYNFTQVSVADKVKEYGFDQYNEDGNITFLQSTSIIICSNTSGINFSHIVNLSLINITLSNCGNGSVAAIYTFNISNLLMDGVSIENSLGYGFLGLNVLGQSQFVRSSFIANNQFMKDMLMKTNVGSLRCNGTDYDYNTAYFNNVSTDCSAAIFGGSMHLHFDDSSHVSSSNQLSFSHLVFSLGVDGTFGPQCSENRGTGLSIKLAQTTFMHCYLRYSPFKVL